MGRADMFSGPTASGGGSVASDVLADASPSELLAELADARAAENRAVFRQLRVIAALHQSFRPDDVQREADRRRSRRDTSQESLHESLVVTDTAVGLKVTEPAARRRVDAALALLLESRLPEAAALMRLGLLDWARVNILVMGTRDLTDEQAGSVERMVLAGRGPDLTIGRFQNEVDRAVLTVDADALERRRKSARADRRVTFWKVRNGSGALDGRAELCLSGPAEAVRAAWVCVDAAARHLRKNGDPRTLDQLRHDLVVTGCTTGALPVPQGVLPGPAGDPPASQGVRSVSGSARPAGTAGAAPDESGSAVPAEGDWTVVTAPLPDVPAHITVTVALETLLGLNEHPGLLDGYGPITAEMARDLAKNGIWRCAAVDGTHGTVLGLGRRTFTPGYVAGSKLREFVKVAAPTCQVPWCGAAAEHCDIDHRTPYADGGATCICTCGPLCRRHHRQKSAGSLTGEASTDPRHPPGTTVWTTHGGQRVVALPYSPLPPEAYLAQPRTVAEPVEAPELPPPSDTLSHAEPAVCDEPPPF